MLQKDKYAPIFLDDFIINKTSALLCSKLFSVSFIPHLLLYGPEGCGKYTLCKALLNTIYKTKIKLNNQILKINNREHLIGTSEYHFEICIDKYSSNKTLLIEIIDYLTDTKEINQACLTKIIILRNINYCNLDIFSFLKNKIEVSCNNYRFFIITNNISYIPDKFRGLFNYIKMPYEDKNVIKKFLKDSNITYDENLLDKNNNLNIFLTKNELSSIVKSKTFSEIKEKQLIKLIKDSINNPDNILKIRNIIYEINIKNIKLLGILKNILLHFLNENIETNKKIMFCNIFSKYDIRCQTSYKTQVHYEALFSELIYNYHS